MDELLLLYSAGMIIVASILLFIAWIKTLRIVRPAECHVVTKGRRIQVFDGKGTYHLLPIIHKVQIIPKGVIEIESSRIKAHDSELLPFEVEVACKIKVIDGLKAAESFGQFSREEDFRFRVKSFVEDTVFSAMRSTAMTRPLLEVMRQRDEIEDVIYSATVDALAKIGISVVLFDIKNIVDAANSTVLRDLERVKSAELKRTARQAEATQDSHAKIVEAQKSSEAEVANQKSIESKEIARIEKEMAVAENQRELSARRLEVINLETKRKAEIEREKIMIQAQAKAEAKKIEAQAEADAIRMKMEAEAEGTRKIAEALQALDQSGISIRIAEIQKDAIIEFSKAMADALRQNSKIFLPTGNGTNFLEGLLPGIALMQETGLDLGSILNGNKHKKKE